VSSTGSAHGFVDDLLSHVCQLAVFGLAHSPQVGERVLDAAPRPSPCALRPPATYSRRSRREMPSTLTGIEQSVPDFGKLPDLVVRSTLQLRISAGPG
jgi:hypothetical protein